MVNTSTNLNPDSLRAQQVKGFVQFQDPTTSTQYWRLKDRQSMSIGYNFGRVEHYQDDGSKSRDWAGYNHTFSMKIKLTTDMISPNYPPNSTNADKATISYWIYQNSPDPTNNHVPTTFTMTFVATQLALSGPAGDPSNKLILHTFVLDPTNFSDITWNTTEGTYEITISGEIISITSIQRTSTDIAGNNNWTAGSP